MKTNQNSNNLPPSCPSCDAEGDIWQKAKMNVTEELRGEKFEVEAILTRCKKCSFEIMAEGDAEGLVRAVRVAYQRKHNLLTADEIIERRKALKMTQEAFAKHIGVGVASVKRWEQGLIQDRSSDELIRKKTDDPAFSAEAVALLEKMLFSTMTAETRQELHEIVVHLVKSHGKIPMTEWWGGALAWPSPVRSRILSVALLNESFSDDVCRSPEVVMHDTNVWMAEIPSASWHMEPHFVDDPLGVPFSGPPQRQQGRTRLAGGGRLTTCQINIEEEDALAATA